MLSLRERSRSLPSRPALWRSPQALGPWFAVLVAAVAVGLLALPPFYFLVRTSLEPQRRVLQPELTLANYVSVLERGGFGDVVFTTTLFALGSSLLAVAFGTAAAWLVERTDVPLKTALFVGAFASLAMPPLIKGIGWILLLGPNAGLVNTLLVQLLGLSSGPVNIFSLGGMVFVEAVLWTPVAFLMTRAPFRAIDPALEDAAAISGGGVWQTFRKVTLPLATPGVLAVLALTFIRSFESFDIPLLLGTPGGVRLATTEIYHTVKSGLVPRYGEASAYAVLLTGLVLSTLVPYYRITRTARKYATVTGRSSQQRCLSLGRARYLAGGMLLLLTTLLLGPVLVLVWASVLPFYMPPSTAVLGSLTLENYWRVLQRPLVQSGMLNSLVVGVSAACLVTLGMACTSWTVVRSRVAAKWIVDALASLPLVFPGIVLGLAVLQIFLALPLPLYGTVAALVYGFALRFMPYGLRYTYAGVLSVHEELEESARVSGAGTLTVLRRIVLPLMQPAMLAAWVYVFLLTVRDLSIALLLSGPHSQVVSVVILDMWQNGQITEFAAFSVMLTILLVVLTLVFWRGTERYGYHG